MAPAKQELAGNAAALLLFFLSGIAGLVYEVSWSRQLGLCFGQTVYAAAIVVAAYFAGMAIGYWYSARLCGRLSRPLAGYGIAEIVVAGWGLAVPSLIAMIGSPQLSSLVNSDFPILQTASRALLAFCAILPATIAMGATLPLIAQHISNGGKSPRSRTALAYALNTAGAMLGVLLATFYLLPVTGVVTSGYLAAGLSALCGVVALVTGFKLVQPATVSIVKPAAKDAAPRIPAVLAFLASFSGLWIMALQVFYIRLFALIFHNSTYSFGIVLAAFLAALALGSALASLNRNPRLAVPFAALACTTGAAISYILVLWFHSYTGLKYFSPPGGFTDYLLAAAGLCAVTIIPPVTILATVLPLTWQAHTGAAGQGANVGRLTAFNTAFAVIGTLLASFVMMPNLGLFESFGITTLIYIAVGLAILHSGICIKARAFKITAYVVLAMAIVPMGQNSHSLYYDQHPWRTFYHKDSAYGLITVQKNLMTEALWMKQDRHYNLGSTEGAFSELRQGHIPLLLHPDPQQVCFLGLATGITASSSLMHSEVKQVTAVELIPEVVEAARRFSIYNREIMDDGRACVVVNDARHFLRSTDIRYDVIVSDLFVPWHSQTGYLYTVEHYKSARRRLNQGGLFCQWIPLYQVSEQELRLIADSFASVFPCVSIWRGEYETSAPILALIGTEAPFTIDRTRFDLRVRALPDSFWGIDPLFEDTTGLLALYVGDWLANPSCVLNTDEHPLVEFQAPISRYTRPMLTDLEFARFNLQVLDKLPRQNVKLKQSSATTSQYPGIQ